jgi:hypothetical protein
MAHVYRARDRVLQHTVAVKVLTPPYDQDHELVAPLCQLLVRQVVAPNRWAEGGKETFPWQPHGSVGDPGRAC